MYHVIMLHRIALGLAFFTCLALSGCDDAASRQSLVGSWDIPPDKVLAGETMSLWFRKYGDSLVHRTLRYTLNPDGTLVIEEGRDRAVCCFGGIDKRVTDRTRRVQLSPGAQIGIRRMLARLRPKNLAPEGPFSLPSGCDYIFDDGVWSGAEFIRGKRYASFIFESGCKGDGADKARRLIGAIVANLPPAERSADFLR